jgi:hypothetical protein
VTKLPLKPDYLLELIKQSQAEIKSKM